MLYYFIDNNLQKGPFQKEKLLGNGLLPKSLVWREGLPDWVEASSLEELQNLFVAQKKSKPFKTLVNILIGILMAVVIIIGIEMSSSNDNDGNPEEYTQVSTSKQSKKLQLHSSISKAEKIRSNSAILKGVLNSKSDDVISYTFEYKRNGITEIIPATLNGDVFYAKITDLQANTRYEYCIVEKQNNGSVKTSSYYFTTLQTPQQIKVKATTHSKGLFGDLFNSYYTKKKNIIEACDYRNNVVRNKAAEVASQTPDNFNIGQVCDIFDYCYDNWKYVNDPSQSDLFQKASNTIRNGLTGDCDDFAILMASMLLSVGGDSRVNIAWTSDSGHAFTELNLGKTDMKVFADYIRARYGFTGSVWFRKDAEGNGWLNLDWWAKHPGGEYYEGKRGVRFYIIDEYLEEFSYK